MPQAPRNYRACINIVRYLQVLLSKHLSAFPLFFGIPVISAAAISFIINNLNLLN